MPARDVERISQEFYRDQLGMGMGTSTTQLKWWKYVLSILHVSALAMGHHQVYTDVIMCCTGVYST
jgi:hypothetical protein